MTDAEQDHFQASCQGAAERKLHDLSLAVDDLTSLAQYPQGAQILQASRAELKSALTKLHDLYLDTQPVSVAAE